VTDYIVCLGRPSKPQINFRICERCEKQGRCLGYKTWALNKVKEETRNKSNRDEETKKRETLLKSLIQNKANPEVKKVRKVRRAK
jgi:hypothetical protein